MRTSFYGFHGDLDLFTTDKLPKKYKLVGTMKRHIPQHSDSTGHSHIVSSDKEFDVYKADDFAYTFAAPATISHEEHRTLDIDPGSYVLLREQEENPRTGLVMEVVD
jgi:hypothetical protein